MTLSDEVRSAVSLLERLQVTLRGAEEPRLGVQATNDLNTLISILHNPFLNKIVKIQDSLGALQKELSRHPSLLPSDFEISRCEGALRLYPAAAERSLSNGAGSPLRFSPTAAADTPGPGSPCESSRNGRFGYDSSSASKRASTPRSSGPESDGWAENGPSDAEPEPGPDPTGGAALRTSLEMPNSITNATMDGELRKLIKVAAEGREIHHIQLYKPDGSSLGFSVVGLKSEQRGDLGIFVQEIQPNGIAAKDSRLRNGDQILAIDGQVLDSFISHHQAIGILQKANKLVELIVARAPSTSDAEGEKGAGLDLPSGLSVLPDTAEPNANAAPFNTTHIVPPSTESRTSNMLNTEWAQVEVIELSNDGSGLGFGIIGGRSTGVVVKTILPGGVADREGRLRSGDHILQIGEVNLRGMGSDQVASVLRHAGTHVRLVVARPVESATPDVQVAKYAAPVVETSVLNDPEELDRRLTLIPNVFPPGPGSTPATVANGAVRGVTPGAYASANGHVADHPRSSDPVTISDRESNQCASLNTSVAVVSSEDYVGGAQLSAPRPGSGLSGLEGPVVEGGEEISIEDLPEMENIDLEIAKDDHGLGITIAGYVCEKEELSGIFVKSVNAGSSADRSGRIQINDQIVEVDGTRLVGLSNHASVEVLRSTGPTVRLRLVRYLRGPKFEQLQQAIANSELRTTPNTPNPPRLSMSDANVDQFQSALCQLESEGGRGPAVTKAAHTSVITIKDSSGELNPVRRFPIQEHAHGGNDAHLEGIELLIDSDYGGELQPSVRAAVIRKWHRVIADTDVEVVVAQLKKYEEGGGLGISLEGTVDVEDGREVRPHHYIRSILADGPVGRDGRLRSGDELLEVNGRKLLGLNHVEVVTILKELPIGVRLVCGRRLAAGRGVSVTPPLSDRVDHCMVAVREGMPEKGSLGGSLQSLVPSPDRLVKAKSDGSLASSSNVSCDNADQPSALTRGKSRSLEPLTGLAMWSVEPQHIDLVKGARGLGFSILDYQDPMNSQETVIVIRSLVPGGVAEKDGRLIPGDRLVAVNGICLEKAALDEAVAALKGAPKGPVIISVAKPVNVLDSPGQLDFILRDRGHELSEGGCVYVDEPDAGTSQARAEYIRQRRRNNDSVLSTSSNERVPEFCPPPADVEAFYGVSLGQNERLIGGKPRSSSATNVENAMSERSVARQVSVRLPAELHQTIVVERHSEQLGVNVELVEDGANGAWVSSLVRGGCVRRDGRIRAGDLLVAVNDVDLRGQPVSAVRGAIRQAGVGPAQVRLTYICGQEAASFRDSYLKSFSGDAASVDSAQLNYSSNNCEPAALPRSATAPSFVTRRSKSREFESPSQAGPALSGRSATVVTVNADPQIESNQSSAEKSNTHHLLINQGSTESGVDGRTPSLEGKHWGPERTIEVCRDEKGSLGISIVGGKVDVSWAGAPVTGIFVKNVLPNSPAGRSGLLKTGDRILQVEGSDLRSASHEKAVEIIKKTGNPVAFLVQSLVQWSAESAPSSRDTSRLGTHAPEHVPQARTPSPELIQPGVAEDQGRAAPAKSRLESAEYDGEDLREVDASDDSDEDDEDDSRNMQGRIFNQNGIEIDRASAAALKTKGDEEDEFGYNIQKIQQRYGDGGGELVLAELQKGGGGLGISLAGHRDRTSMSVFVCGLNPAGAAHKEGTVKVGDEILEVNGYVVEGRSHLNASTIFKGIPGPVVKIVARRKPSGLQDMAVKPLTQFPISLEEESPESKFQSYKGLKNFIMKKGQSGLGIMIIEGKHAEYGNGIFISDLQEGSPAAEAGLMVGDMILQVNSEEMTAMDYDTAASILKKTEGVIDMWVANVARASSGGLGPASSSSPVPSDRGPSPTPVKPEIPPKPPSISKPPIPAKPASISRDKTASPVKPAFNSAPASDEPPKDPSEAEIRAGCETTIEIVKEKMGLGLSIVGGSDTLLGAIIIHEVYPDGAAAKDGRLRPGDQILEVNAEDFRSIAHQKALSVLRQTPSKVKMVVYRESGGQEEELQDVISVQLTKKSGKGLGLSIVGRKNGPGVYISDLVSGGVAEGDGRLMQGDQILHVNEKDLRSASQEQAAAILKCAPSSVTMKVGRLKPGKKPAAAATPKTSPLLPVEEGFGDSKSASSLSADFCFPPPAVPPLTASPGPGPASGAGGSPLPLRSVALERGEDGLGFSIVGGFGSNLGDLPIYVKSVFERGAAATEGSLKRGDQIVQVNGISLAGLSHAQAVAILKDAKGAVLLTILPSK